MELALQTHSYRNGEVILNTKSSVKKELEDILLSPSQHIAYLSRDEYVEIVRGEFLSKGWQDRPSVMDRRRRLVPLMDYRKGGVGVTLGLHSNSPQPDLMRFQTARQWATTAVEVGVYVTLTAESQKELARQSGKPWSGPTFGSITRALPPLARLLQTPVCIMGIEVAEQPLKSLDLERTAPSIVKKLILEFLEKEYEVPVYKGVRIVGKHVDLEFDGVMRLPEKDVIFAIEMSRSSGTFPTRLVSDSISSYVAAVKEYRQVTRPEACLRFVLIGNYTHNFIQDVFGPGGVAYGWAEGIEVEYEIHSFTEFEEFLATKRQVLKF